MSFALHSKSICSRIDTWATLLRSPSSGIQAERATPKSQRLSVLAVTSNPAIMQQLRDLSARHHWRLQEASTLREVWAILHGQSFGVIVTDARLPGGGWREVLSEAESVTVPPALVVLESPEICERLDPGEQDDVELVHGPIVAAELEQAVIAAAGRRSHEEERIMPLLSLSAVAAR